MREAVIVSTTRTPIGKAYRGSLTDTHSSDLAAHVITEAIERAGVSPAEIDDVMLGSAHPEGATGNNIARGAALRAGCPVSVPGMTLDRKCSSGLQTIALASQRIMAGEAGIYVAGGVDSVSLVGPSVRKFQKNAERGVHCRTDVVGLGRPSQFADLIRQ